MLEPGLTPLKLHQTLTESEYIKAQEDYGEDSFTASIGAEAVREMLMAIKLDAAARTTARRAEGCHRRPEAKEAGQAPEDRGHLH